MSTTKAWLPPVGAGVLVLLLSLLGARTGQAEQSRKASLRPPGKVDIRVYPWARVTIDGVKHGLTPWAQAVSLSAGEHLIRAEHPTLGSRDLRVMVRPGAADVVRLDMIPETKDSPEDSLIERLEQRRRHASSESLLLLARVVLDRSDDREVRRLAARHAAHALLQLDRIDEARDFLQRHLENDPDFAPDALWDSPLVVSLWPTRS